jgi:hypothetical protein
MPDYPQYQIAVQLDNGMSFTAQFGPLPGLPQDVEDALAAAASAAIRDFGWSALPVVPQVTSAVVTLTRQGVASTGIVLP